MKGPITVCTIYFVGGKAMFHALLPLRHQPNSGWRAPDFSFVLFRSDFILVSKKNRMKVHKNLWIFDHAISSKRLAGATRRGQTRAPEEQKPSTYPCLTAPH